MFVVTPEIHCESCPAGLRCHFSEVEWFGLDVWDFYDRQLTVRALLSGWQVRDGMYCPACTSAKAKAAEDDPYAEPVVCGGPVLPAWMTGELGQAKTAAGGGVAAGVRSRVCQLLRGRAKPADDAQPVWVLRGPEEAEPWGVAR